MVALTALWLPIVLSAVFVFVASSIIHMTPLWHKTDYPRYASEDRVLDALRPLGVPPGEYMMPRPADMKEMRSPAFQEKMKRGPAVLMTVFPPFTGSMGSQLALWFVYILVISYFVAYIASRTLAPATTYLQVFRLVGAAAFLAYAAAQWQASIWYRRPWSITLKNSLDGLIYALLTAGVFGWLWPR